MMVMSVLSKCRSPQSSGRDEADPGFGTDDSYTSSSKRYDEAIDQCRVIINLDETSGVDKGTLECIAEGPSRRHHRAALMVSRFGYDPCSEQKFETTNDWRFPF